MTRVLGSDRKPLYRNKTQALIALLIFGVCIGVYLANHATQSSQDTLPNSLLALNWLENHTLHFDVFRSILPVHFLALAPNGHVTSTYPIGVAILSFPLYCLFFIYLKALSFFQIHFLNGPGININIADPAFEPYRQMFEKLAGTILTAFSVVLFYLSVRLKFEQGTALLTTFVFAFATSIWSTSSQGLWQHTGNTVLLTGAMLCFLKAHRTTGRAQKCLLIVAGFCSGLLPGTRTTSLLYAIALLLYAIAIYRRTALYFVLGFSSILFNIVWNLYYFGFHWSGLLIGGYTRYDKSHGTFMQRFYRWTIPQFVEGSLGLLINPNVGLLVFSPITLFALPGIRRAFQQRFQKDELLLGVLAIASVGIFLQYCFFTVWSGGGSYGSRYLTDIMPVLCYFIAYFVAGATVPEQDAGDEKERRTRLSIPVFRRVGGKGVQQSVWFGLALVYSVYVQIIGVFGTTAWYHVPFGIPLVSSFPTITEGRLWQIQDGAIERHTRSLYYRIVKPLPDPVQYLGQLAGRIDAITIGEDNRPLLNPLIQPTQRQNFVALNARVTNTGTTVWYGYETGMTVAIACVQVQIVGTDPQKTPLGTFPLFVSGNIAPGEEAIATGYIRLPETPGDYRLSFALGAYAVGQFPHQTPTVVDLTMQPATVGRAA